MRGLFFSAKALCAPLGLALAFSAAGHGAPAPDLSRALPIVFEPNVGQARAEVLCLARAGSTLLEFTANSLRLLPPGRNAGAFPITMELENANARAPWRPESPLSGRSNYFRGTDPGRWRKNVSHFARARLERPYPGTDLVVYGRDGRIEFDFELAPHADPGAIRWRYRGADRVVLDGNGDLLLEGPRGTLRQHRPVIYQVADGRRREIPGSFLLLSGGRVGFRIGSYDRSRPLVIDPVVSYGTYLGGDGRDAAYAVAVDADGSVYVTGSTESADFPTHASAFQRGHAGGSQPSDVFVTKLNAAGTAVAYSTFLGGARDDTALAIAVDAQGVAYITGTTYSPDFPTTPGVLSREFGDPSWDIRGDGFLVKLGVNGSELAFSTYLPASEGDMVTGVAVDPDGNIHLTGHTYSDDWPTTRTAHQDVFCVGFGYDSFYTKLTPAGNSILYSTYLCGGGHDMAQAIALDGAGNIYIAGRTESADFPTTGGSHTDGEKDDAFLTKFDPTGKLLWSRFVGGRGADAALALVVDSQNRPAIAGSTTSSDLPASGGVFQSQHADSGQYGDAFAAGFEAANGSLRWLSYYGGGNHDYATGLSMDSSGNVYLAGFTASPDLPTTSTACMTGYRGGGDAFVAKFSPGAAALDWSLFFGGNDRDAAHGVAIDRQGAVYAAGQTFSGNFPTSAEALASAYGRGLRGVSDAFVLKLAPGAAPAANCIAINGVLNNASMLPGPVSPGEIVTIFGAGLGPDAPALFELTPDNRMKTGIAGTRILFDNTPAPVIFTYAYQVAAVVPYSLAGKTSTMLQVEYRGVKTPAVKLGVTDAAPAVFTINSSGRGPGAILNQDYSVNSAANPAARGSIVMIFATGEGQTSPPGQDGLLALGVLPAPLLPIRLLVGNTQAELVYAGAAPGLVAGVMQVNAKIPVDIPPGSAVPLTLIAGERRSPPGVTIAVK